MSERVPDEEILRRLEQLEGRLDVLFRRLQRIEKGERRAPGPLQPPPSEPEPAEPPTPSPPPSPPHPPPRPPVDREILSPAAGGADHTDRAESPAPSRGPAPLAESPAPRPSPPPPPRSALPWEPGFDGRELLKKLSLLPPSPGTDFEIHVGTWWATRIGILLAVLAGVFFAVWVSQHTTPPIKFAELVAASVVLAGAGLWLERRFEQFGRVVFAGGLALLFFSMWAGYAVPAVKVIDTPATATVLQFGAVGIIILCALWKDSPLIATMATFLGYAACLFSVHVGFSSTSLIAGFLLGAGAVVFYLAKGWMQPIQVAVPFAYLVYGAVFFRVWRLGGGAPSFPRSVASLIVYLSLFWTADFISLAREQAAKGLARNLVQMCNSSAAVVLGYAVTFQLFHDRLSTFFFLVGGILLAMSVAQFVTGRRDAVMHGLLLKGVALITFGVMTEYGALTRCVTLAAQAFLLLFAARRSRLQAVEIASVIVWLVSFGYFCHYTTRLSWGEAGPTIWTTSGVTSVVYLLVSALLFSLRSRWFGIPEHLAPMPLDPPKDFKERPSYRNLVNVMGWITVAVVGMVIAANYLPETRAPLGATVLALLVSTVGLGARHWLPHDAARLILYFAHYRMWGFPVPTGEMSSPVPILLNAFVVIGVTIGAAAIHSNLTKQKGRRPIDEYRLVDGLDHVLWMATLQVALYKILGLESYLFLAMVASMVVTAVAERFPFYTLRDLAPLPLAMAFAGWLFSVVLRTPRLPETGEELYLWLATFGAFGLAARYGTYRSEGESRASYRGLTVYPWLTTLMATILGWYTLASVFDDEYFMLMAAVGALAVLPLLRWPGLKPVLATAAFYLLLAHAWFYRFVLENPKLFPLQGPWTEPGSHHASTGQLFLWLAVVVSALTLAYPALARYLAPRLPRDLRRFLESVGGAAALALLFVLFLSRRDALQNYITVLWGISSVSVFLVGLALRSRAFRLVGLAGLAICIVRVFLVDIRSMYYRIFAFGVLAAVILVIAYLYNRYRDSIIPLDEQRFE